MDLPPTLSANVIIGCPFASVSRIGKSIKINKEYTSCMGNTVHGVELDNTVQHTALKMKFFIKDFFSKCDQIHSFLQI